MNKTEIKKGFIISIPKLIVEKADLKEGEKLLIESPASGVIVLERPGGPDAIEASRGLWKGRKEIDESIKYVSKIRKGWEKRTRRSSLGK